MLQYDAEETAAAASEREAAGFVEVWEYQELLYTGQQLPTWRWYAYLHIPTHIYAYAYTRGVGVPGTTVWGVTDSPTYTQLGPGTLSYAYVRTRIHTRCGSTRDYCMRGHSLPNLHATGPWNAYVRIRIRCYTLTLCSISALAPSKSSSSRLSVRLRRFTKDRTLSGIEHLSSIAEFRAKKHLAQFPSFQ